MSTASKLWFGFGLLLSLLIGTGLFVAHRLAMIERAITTIMAVQEPATAATYDMALNVSGSGAAVLHYVTIGDPEDRALVATNNLEFERLMARYNRVARSEASLGLGRQIQVAFQRFTGLADTLLEQSDRHRASVSNFASSREALDAIFARDLLPLLDGKGKDGPRKQVEAAGLQADAAQLASALGLYLEARSSKERERLAAAEVAFRSRLRAFEELRVTDAERDAVRRLGRGYSEYYERALAAAEGSDRERQLVARFSRIAKQIELLVNEGIHSLARTDLIEAQQSSRRAIHFSMLAVIVLLVAGIFVGGITALPVGRSVVRSEQALRERMEELAVTHRRKDEFLGVLGHELRNPLAPLSNSLHVLEANDAGAPAAVREAHAMMKRQVQNMTRLVDDLLDVSRVNEGKIALRREPLNLSVVTREVAEDLRPLAEAAGNELRVKPPGEEVWVQADPTRLVQIVSNLVHNAVKYTPRGGVIELSSGVDEGDAVLRVADTGVGIPREMLKLIFEPFTQVDASMTRGHGGLGIGLTLARRLAVLHDGGLRADSEGRGRGSTLTLRLPRIATPSAAAKAAAAEERAAATREGAKNGAPRRILVVDDNHDSAQSLADLLRIWGHEVEIAHDGPSALERAEEGRPDLVLLDIGLPGMDGYEVAERLRARRKSDELSLIALTGLGRQEDRRRALEAGFDHHLTKPISPPALRELLERREN